MNDWKVSGRLTKEPWVSDAGKVLKMTIAVDKKLSNEEKEKKRRNAEQTADFFELTLFQEGLIKWVKDLKKGDMVLCSCRLQNGTPYSKTGSDGYPMKVKEEQKIIREIEIINRYKPAEQQPMPSDYVHQEDPIQVDITSDSKLEPPTDW